MRSLSAAALLAVVGAMFVVAGCSEPAGGDLLENSPPVVWLASAPPSGSETHYQVHMYWGGWDPDGEVSHFEYIITDNDGGVFDPADTTTAPGDTVRWRRTSANDSLFTFSADELVDSTTTDPVSRFERSHTFFVRAVDHDGRTSVEAAHRSFTAWTLSPSISITVPRQQGLTPILVAPVATFRWHAEDYVQDRIEPQPPDSVRWILKATDGVDYDSAIEYIRANPRSPEWSGWRDYQAPGDSGHFWVSDPIDLGSYVFAVQAKDEAGAVTPVFDEKTNLRRLRVALRNSGPVLDLSNEYTGTLRSSVLDAPAVIVDLPANLPLSFTISANADHYGGLVTGYRYGWDIADLNDPDQWEVDYTPFTSGRGDPAATTPSRTFHFGTHTLTVEVADNTGARSRIELKINVIPFTMERSLLLVDDFEPVSAGLAATRGAVPNDEEHDTFWQFVLEDVVGFSMEDDQITVRSQQPLPITRVSSYKSIIWDAWGGYDISPVRRPKLYDLVSFRSKDWTWSGAGRVEPNVLLLFLRAGGHLMVCGHQPLTQAARLTALKYPVILRFELEGDQDGFYVDQLQRGPVGDESFGYRDACLDVIDVAYFNSPGRLRSQAEEGCPVNLQRDNSPKTDGLRVARPLDARFPELELRREVSSLGDAFHEDRKGLNTELYNPPYFSFCEPAGLSHLRPCFQPIYGNGCLNENSVVYNAPVAYWSAAYAGVVPDIEDGVAARSVYLGFDPFYFKPNQVREMMGIILFEEWGLRRF